MPKKRKTSLGHKQKQGRRRTLTASLMASATALTATPSWTASKATNKGRKDPPGLTARKAAKATAALTATAKALMVPEIPKNLVEIWKVPVLRAKLLKILSEEEATVAPDGRLKAAATATTEATNSPAGGLDGLEAVADAAETADVGTQTNQPT